MINNFFSVTGHHIEVEAHKVHLPLSSLSLRDIVTFTYDASFINNNKNDAPVNVEIIRKRGDLEWQDVIISAATEEKFLNGINNYY